MKNLLPTLAVLVLLPASLWAGARGDLTTCSENSNDPACFGNSNAPSNTDVDASGATGQGASHLARSTSRGGAHTADVAVPEATPAKKHGRLGFLKSKKMMLGLLAGGGGAYFGYTHMAAFGSLGGPWGAAAMGAVGGILLGMIVLPKLFHLFHRHKR